MSDGNAVEAALAVAQVAAEVGAAASGVLVETFPDSAPRFAYSAGEQKTPLGDCCRHHHSLVLSAAAVGEGLESPERPGNPRNSSRITS